MLLVLRFLKGRTNRVLRAGSKAGADRNRSCVAVAFTVVIYAIVHVTMDALNVLLAAAARAILLIVHSDDLLISSSTACYVTVDPIFPHVTRAYTAHPL